MTGGSNTVGGKANRVARISNGVVASLIVGSHVHLPLTFKEDIIMPGSYGSVKQMTITYVITPAFLSYGDYAQRNNYKPATIAVPKIYIVQNRDKTEKRERYFDVRVLL